MIYPLCDRTVTIYRLAEGQVQRRVATGCLYRWEDRAQQDSAGVKTRRSFLLIQPGENPIYPGDRIYEGEGGQVTAEQWAEFLPERVAGLSLVSYARPYHWQGKICHWEAGN